MRFRRSKTALQILVPWLLAAGAAWGTYHLVRDDQVAEAPDLGEVLRRTPLVTRHVEAVERSWIDDAFRPRYLPVPVVHLPCPTGIRAGRSVAVRLSNAKAVAEEGRIDDAVALIAELDRQYSASWVPGLTLGAILLRSGRLSQAEAVLRGVYERPVIRSLIADAVTSAVAEKPHQGPPTEDVSGMIHLLHAYGYVLIETHRGGSDLWRALRHPIGCAKLLALRGDTDRLRRMPTWDEHRLPTPGCRATRDTLTTLDLYNNLIVGYLEHDDFRETPDNRKKELGRGYEDPPEENPLLAVLDARSDELIDQREHWVWAVSNAERLLKQRRESGLGPLTNSRLAYNLAALMESALDMAPPAAQEALRGQKDDLVEIVLRGRDVFLPQQLGELDEGLARLLLIESVRTGEPATWPASLGAHLRAGQQETAATVRRALELRSDPAAWQALAAPVTGAGDPPSAGPADPATAEPGPGRSLGAGSEEWRRASRQDLAASLARHALDAGPDDRRAWAWWARSLLEPEDPQPEELSDLEAGLGWWWRLSPRRFVHGPWVAGIPAVIAAAAAWLLGAWIALQLRQRRDLFTSFYRLEARRQVGRSR